MAAETFTSVRPFRDLDAAFNPGVAIGHHAGYPTSPHNYAFHGRIDELSVYDQALTAEEVLAIYESSTDNNTKYYVVNDGTANRTYEYDATGADVESYSMDSGNSTPRGAASTMAGDKVWVIDANRNVYVYGRNGNRLGSWSVGGFSASAQLEGIAVSGTDVWIVDNKSDKVYRYTGAASRLSGSQSAATSFALNSGNKDASDLVTDGTSIWVLNNTSSTDKVFKYNISDTTLLGSWTINSGGGNPTGITIRTNRTIGPSAVDIAISETGEKRSTSSTKRSVRLIDSILAAWEVYDLNSLDISL